jgi:hypothetical protein
MKRTLSTYEVAGLLMSDEYAKWSRNAAYAIAEYYENLEQETGEEIAFCPVAIRCDWSEFRTAVEVVECYGLTLPEEERTESLVEDYLSENTEYIKLPDGGYLVQNF